MAKTILFLAISRDSPTMEEQRAAFAAPEDLIVDAGRLSLSGLSERLVRKGVGLETGDTLKIPDLACVGVATSTLVRILVEMLRAGISIELCRPPLKIVPGTNPSDSQHLLEALDTHWRRIHGIKTKEGAKAKRGRKPRLQDNQLAAVRDMLSQPGATTTTVARELSLSRSTLFYFLSRHGVSAR